MCTQLVLKFLDLDQAFSQLAFALHLFPFKGDVVLMNLILQRDDLVALVLHLLNVFLLTCPLFRHCILIKHNKSFKVLIFRVQLLDSLCQTEVLALLDLDASLCLLDLLLYLIEVQFGCLLLVFKCLKLYRFSLKLILKVVDSFLCFFLQFLNLHTMFFPDLSYLLFKVIQDLGFVRDLKVYISHIAFHISVDVVH